MTEKTCEIEVVQALEGGDEGRLRSQLEAIGELVNECGERLHDAHHSASDLIIPPADLTLEEARALFRSGRGW